MKKTPKTVRARELRNNATDYERALWHKINRSQLGVKFRRQYPFGPYFVDFVCKEKKLIIELDGDHHGNKATYDQARSAFFEQDGYTVLRFWNNEIIENLEGTIETIMEKLNQLPPHPPRLRGGEQHPDPSPPASGGARGGEQSPEPQTIELISAEIKSSGLEKMRVVGGAKLKGEIPVSGAKNAALKHMCAALLTDEPVQFTNMPCSLVDVRTLAQVLNHLGMTVALRSDGVAILRAKEITSHVAPYDLVRKMRASVIVLGPLLARHGEAEVSLPGGCALGGRPVDLHIQGLKAMGAEIDLDGGYIKARAPKGLKGAEINFPVVSVGATENLMMAAALAKGETVLKNAAREPEIVDQGQALIKMGAKIEGLGTPEIHIQGVDRLKGATHDVVADRIETGTYMCAVGLCGGDVRLKNTRTDFLSALVSRLEAAGVEIKQDGKDVLVHRNGARLKGVDIMTEPYPGFPTDLQAQFMTMLTLCDGAGMVTETIFENRFMHVPELARMGADITVHGNTALVRGVEKLKGAEVMATDLRASVSLILAGLVAEGETTVNRIYHLDRGYEHITEKLGAVGAQIERVKG